MEISQLKLFWLFFYSLCGGAAVGIGYDLTVAIEDFAFSEVLPKDSEKSLTTPFRIVKLIREIYRILRDVFSVVIASLVMILVAYSANSGIMRWMIPAGTVAGMLVYYATLGKVAKRLLKRLFGFLRLITFVPAKYFIKYAGTLWCHIISSINKRKQKMKGEGNGGKKGKRRNR